MYAESNQQMDQLHDFLVASTQSMKDFQQAMLNQARGVLPLASYLPAPSTSTLMIQAPPTGLFQNEEPRSTHPVNVPVTLVPPTPAPTPLNPEPAQTAPAPNNHLEEIATLPPLPTEGSCPETPPPPPVPQGSSDVQPAVAVVDTGGRPVEPAVEKADPHVLAGEVPVESADVVESIAPSAVANAPTGCFD